MECTKAIKILKTAKSLLNSYAFAKYPSPMANVVLYTISMQIILYRYNAYGLDFVNNNRY